MTPRVPQALALLLVTLSIVVTGRLGHALSLHGVNVTLFWPPSGISLVAFLVLGARALPAVWLGITAVTAWGFLDKGLAPSAAMALMSAAIGAGAALLPVAGRAVLRRLSDPGQPFGSLGRILGFLAAAPVMCLVSAGVGTASLLAGGAVPPAAAAGTFATWLAGDTLGVWIFAPFILFLRQIRAKLVVFMLLLVSGGTLVTLAFSTTLRDQAERVWRDQAATSTQQYTSGLLLRLDLSYAAITSVKALFAGSSEVDEDEFIDTTDTLEAAQTAYFPNTLSFARRSVNDGSWRIVFSTDAVGDLGTEAVIDGASPLGQVLEDAWSRPAHMRLGDREGLGGERLLVVAVRADSQTQEGVLVATVDLTNTLEGMFNRSVDEGLYLNLNAERTTDDGQVETVNLVSAPPPHGVARTLSYRTLSGGSVLDFQWLVAPEFAGGGDYGLANAVLLSGLGATAMVGLFFMVLLFRNESIESRVAERTREVEKNTELLRAVMGSMGQGIVAYDETLKIVAYNQHFTAIRGYPPDLVFEGQSFENLMRYDIAQGEFGEDDPERVLHEKIAVARHFQDHRFERKRPDGRFIEVQGGPVPGGGFVSTFTDITNRRRNEEKIKQQVADLDRARKATLNMMADAEAARRALQEVLTQMSASIAYASRIQRSVLPPAYLLEVWTADHFVIWEPRDVVGGDLYWARPWGEGLLLALIDCTGHGVPGAFMTLISEAALARAVLDTAPGDLNGLIRHAHHVVQTTLGQDSDEGDAGDGLELGVCYLEPGADSLRFCGARFDLFMVDGDAVTEVRGTKKGVGYRGIPEDQTYAVHVIELLPGRQFHMTSDGLIDQVGGENRRGFGKRRFKEALLAIRDLPMAQQGERLRAVLADYQGRESRRDDVSVIGFRVD